MPHLSVRVRRVCAIRNLEMEVTSVYVVKGRSSKGMQENQRR